MQNSTIKVMKKVGKPKTYEEFKSYLKTIVLYSALNKRNRDWDIKRKATINFTMRQLEKTTGIPRSTCSRWLKKMREEGILGFSHIKKTRKGFQNMKFYYIKEIILILKAKAKVKAYNFIKKKIKIESRENGTPLINLFHKFKYIKKKLLWGLESRDFRFEFESRYLNLSEIDSRKNDPEKIVPLDAKIIASFFGNLLEEI